jgi:hypothetical protein
MEGSRRAAREAADGRLGKHMRARDRELSSTQVLTLFLSVSFTAFKCVFIAMSTPVARATAHSANVHELTHSCTHSDDARRCVQSSPTHPNGGVESHTAVTWCQR